jgi:hypothetical protein
MRKLDQIRMSFFRVRSALARLLVLCSQPTQQSGDCDQVYVAFVLMMPIST